MKLAAFHAADGDCLLLSSSDDPPRRMLVDGGRKGSYESHTRAFIGGLREAGERIDVVCVSHIDDDHISGILRLVEDEVDWRAFAFLQSLDPPRGQPPRAARPAEIGEVWHNGLFRLVGDDLGPVVEGVLECVAMVLASSADEARRDLASRLGNLATGERSSMELSRRLSPEQLGIPLNVPAGGELMRRGTVDRPAAGEEVALGGLRIVVLGPSEDNLDRHRRAWQQWIDGNQAALEQLQAQMLAEEERLGMLSPRVVASPRLEAALGQGLSGVTPANLASLVLLVEEGPHSVLLTGDGVSSEIIAGLARHGKLDAGGRLHVSVLKVQHHGALANVEADFVKRVTADHYVFCENGAHDNPEDGVVEAFARARLEGIDGSGPVGPPTAFTLWFTSSANTRDLTPGRRRQGHEARMTARFLDAGRFEIDVSAGGRGAGSGT